MSHVLQPLDGRPTRYGIALPTRVIHAEQCLDEVLHRFTQPALDMVTDSVVFFSAPTMRVLHLNRAACDCLGYSPAHFARMSLLDIAPQANRGHLAEIIRRAMHDAAQEASTQTVYRHRSGPLIPVHCSIRALCILPESLLVAVGRDISIDGVLNSRFLNAEFRDGLTFLPNRAWLWRQLEGEVQRARQSDYQFAVLFVDVDRFKAINDSFGHLAGDQVLQAIARRLRASVRPNDDVARYGGDEFVVLMKNVQIADDVRRIAERIGRFVNAAGKHRKGNVMQAQVTVSVGVAITGGTGTSVADVIDRADRAMYRAKALGRNGRFVMDESTVDLTGVIGTDVGFDGLTRQFE
jgi:diguanylate cyclase (GGDEF)-like protein/PAS domain S-box-containing protein